MPRITPMLRPLLLFIAGVAVQSAPAQQTGQQTGQQTVAPTQDLFPGYTATANSTPFPGITASPIGSTPLATPPSVISLDHLDPAQMSTPDYDVVSNLSAELSKAAALSGFDISNPEWRYQQVVCPAFSDYVFLAFMHGPDPNGSSRFVAMLPRNSAQVRIVSTYAHGLLPFEASWSKPATYEIFNGMLRAERGTAPLSSAPNWLMISLCYAELSGYPVQMLAYDPRPEASLDLVRLDANQPQMMIQPDRSAEVTFSDVSEPTITTNWSLHFNRHGQITSAGRSAVHQAPSVALKP